MTERNELLDRAVALFPEPADALERVLERHRRRQRNRRIAAAAVGVAIAVLIVATLVSERIRTNQVPAVPAPIGSIAPGADYVLDLGTGERRPLPAILGASSEVG